MEYEALWVLAFFSELQSRITLNYKKISYEYEPVHLLNEGGEQNKSSYSMVNPMRQVPSLEDGEGLVLGQSVAIVEYLEEKYPDPALYPKDAVLRARVREIVEIVNSGIQPLQNLRVTQQLKTLGVEPKAWVQANLHHGFQALESRLVPLAGQFAIGNTVTMADVFLAPQVYGARRFDVDMTLYPTIERVVQSALQLPEFIAAHPDQQPDAVV